MKEIPKQLREELQQVVERIRVYQDEQDRKVWGKLLEEAQQAGVQVYRHA